MKERGPVIKGIMVVLHLTIMVTQGVVIIPSVVDPFMLLYQHLRPITLGIVLRVRAAQLPTMGGVQSGIGGSHSARGGSHSGRGGGRGGS
ncbi:hypothetical protein H5410_040795 [Solanum commersonii]|uniref:Uncharacterized protein n=1 Tax=Solanum commersonii TaxID=4109 RepID=A0A9J5XPZ7_SOLCO|nr:hypothetical protein H5410_040795 [Solanum commersonii]